MWGASNLRHGNALSILWILMSISSHTAPSPKEKKEYHMWSISPCPGQMGGKDPHQGEISPETHRRSKSEILWGIGTILGKIRLNFSFFSEVMRASGVAQLSYHSPFQALSSCHQQLTVKGGISGWMRKCAHLACSLPAAAFQRGTPPWCANTLVIIYSWPFPSPAPAAAASLVESGLVEIAETMCSETC